MARPICRALRKDGSPCRGPSLPGSDRCWVHDPEHAELAAEARARGAVKAAKLRSIESRRKRLDSPRALSAFLSGLLHDLADGKADADLARTIAYVVSVQTRVIEQARQSDVEAMLAEVRQLTAEARRRA
jgi:hypothetical protein